MEDHRDCEHAVRVDAKRMSIVKQLLFRELKGFPVGRICHVLPELMVGTIRLSGKQANPKTQEYAPDKFHLLI